MIATGSYVGDSTTDRTIPLAFTPKFVITILNAANRTYISNFGSGNRGFQMNNGLTPSGTASNTLRPKLTDYGFIVSGNTTGTLNFLNDNFNYYAIG